VGSVARREQRELWARPPRGHLLLPTFFAELTSYRHGCKGTCHRRLQLRWWSMPDLPLAPPRARHRRLQLRWWSLPDLPPAAPGGPPSTSPTPVVAAAKPADSNSQGAHHRHLQLWWWSLPNLPTAPPRGPTIDVSNSGGSHCRTADSNPQGARHRCLQLRWWPLPDLPTAPPGPRH
jgi:hypothetical protein